MMRILGLTLIIFSFLNISDNSHIIQKIDQVTCPTEVDRLAIKVLTKINPESIENDIEYGGTLYTTLNGIVSATIPYTDSNSHTVNVPTLRMLHIIGHQIARYHTHGAESENYQDEVFSELDTGNVSVDQYLITPDWKILKFDCHVRRVYKYNITSDIWTIEKETPPEEEYFPVIPKLELYYKLPWLYNPNFINF